MKSKRTTGVPIWAKSGRYLGEWKDDQTKKCERQEERGVIEAVLHGGISKELFDSVCAERDALYEEVSELKRSRDDAPTVYFLPGPDSWTDERIHGVTHSAKVIDIKKLSEF